MKVLSLGGIAFLLSATTALAVPMGSAFANGSLFFEAFLEDPFIGQVEVDLDVTGRSFVDASVRVEGLNDIGSDRDETTFTITNNQAGEVEIFVELMVLADASTSIDYADPPGTTRFDSNAFVSLSGISTFASTNGTYSCSNADETDVGFDCFGLSESGFDDGFDSLTLFLAPGESRSFAITATAFSFLETEIASVPLTATAPLLAFALTAGFWVRRRHAW